MQGFLIWGAFTIVVAAACLWRPQVARIFVGLFFGAMGLGIHGALIATDPQTYVDFADSAPWAVYRDIGTWLTELNPLAFGVFMLIFETVTAALILSRGRLVKWGLLAAIVFLVGITPLGLEEVPNVVLAAGMAFLLTQDFPADAWTVLRHHGRRGRADGERASTSAPGAATCSGSEGAVSPRTRRLCAAAAMLVVVAAVPTFFVDGVLNGTAVMNGSARGTALTMFALALPVLGLGLVTSARGSVRGRAAAIGALGYLTYNAMLLVYATPFNELFLAYVALLGLSLWSLVSALIDPLPLLAPDTRLPARGIAAFILTVVVLNALAWLRVVVPDLGQDPPGFLDGTGLTTNPIYVQDLAIWLPALAIVAVLLWKRRPSGIFLAGAGLVFWMIEAIGVAVDQWFGHRADPGSDVATLPGAVLFVVLAGVTLVPLVLWLRAAPPPTHEAARS